MGLPLDLVVIGVTMSWAVRPPLLQSVTQGFSQDEKTASPHNFLTHKNNVVNEIQGLKK